jgi:hypothetical protein
MVDGVDYVTVNMCKLYKENGEEVVHQVITHDLVPSTQTTFIYLKSLTVNSKYSEREIYGEAV